MARRPPGDHGPWYYLSLVNPAGLFLAWRGSLGPRARDESQLALDDWARALATPLGYAALALAAAGVLIALVALLR